MFEAISINGQTWLICGGRDFADGTMFEDVMARLIRLRGMPAKVVHGGYRGADTMADEWGRHFALEVVPVKAEWTKYGNAAGPIRNQRMLDEHRPNFLIAFPGHDGTADMVRKARAAGIDVAEIKPTGTAVR